jgi:uncharacterized membrane protein
LKNNRIKGERMFKEKWMKNQKRRCDKAILPKEPEKLPKDDKFIPFDIDEALPLNVRKTFPDKEKNIGSLLSICLAIIYIVVWTTVLCISAYTFHLGIFDYGFNIQLIAKESSIFGFNFSGTWYIPFLSTNKLITFAFVPFFILLRNSYMLIFVESIIFGISGYLIYLIFMELLSNSKYAVIGQLMWYIYYPNNVSNFFVFHYLTLFTPFYLFGIYLYIKGRNITGALSLGISCFAVLLAPVINIFTIISLIMLRRKYNEIGSRKFFHSSLLIILSFSLLVISINIIVGHGGEFFAGARLASGTSTSSGNIVSIILQRLMIPILSRNLLYIFMDIIPFLLLPLIEPIFIFPIIPVILYFIFGNSIGLPFYFPGQWVPLYSPQIFIAFALILKGRETDHRNHWKNISKHLRKVKNSHLIETALVINIVLFCIYSPLGPANQLLLHEPNGNPPSNGNYNFYKDLEITEYDINLNRMANLVPLNSSILTQFNMATLSNRYEIYYPGTYNYSMNAQYLLNNPYTDPYWFTTGTADTSPSYPGTMMSFSNSFLSNSSYGVFGESQGALLLKEHYHGKPNYYVPFGINHHFFIGSSGETNITLLLPPGNLMFSITGSGNTMLKFGNIILFLSGQNQLVNSSLYFPFYGYYTFNIKGTGSAHALQVDQIAPATIFNYKSSNFIPPVNHIFTSNYTNTEKYSIKVRNISNSSVSYAYWINVNTFEDGKIYPTNLGNDSYVLGASNFGFWNQIENNGFFEFGLRTTHSIDFLRPFTIGTDHWFFVTMTYYSGYVFIYLNGVIVYSSQVFSNFSKLDYGDSANLTFGSIHPFLVNGKTAPNTNPFNGSLYDFTLFNCALTPTEVYTIYSLGANSLSIRPTVELFNL